MRCSGCGINVSDVWLYCPMCGEKLQKIPKKVPMKGRKYCSHCKETRIEEARVKVYDANKKYLGLDRYDSKFCTKCGTELLSYEEALLSIPIKFEEEILKVVTDSEGKSLSGQQILDSMRTSGIEITGEEFSEALVAMVRKGSLKIDKTPKYHI